MRCWAVLRDIGSERAFMVRFCAYRVCMVDGITGLRREGFESLCVGETTVTRVLRAWFIM
jgi:hypothetical protein